jgi:hypothetical protein
VKSPWHLFNLAELVAEYPDACIVWCHRDPARCLASLVDLLRAVERGQGRAPDRATLATEVLAVYGPALDRAVASRVDPAVEARIFDVAHRDTMTAPLDTVRRVHERFDLPVTAEHERRMEAFVAEHPRPAHVAGRVDDALDPDDLRPRFAAYAERFGAYC